MNRTSARRLIAPSIATLALGLALSACGAGNESDGGDSGSGDLSGTLNGAGSSAQEAAFTAWRAAFQGDNSGVTINYDPSGSGAGREQFIAGGVSFAGSDSYMSDEELASSKDAAACDGQEAIGVPSYISPIAVIYNLPGVDSLQLSADTISKIFNGSITTWNDPAIAAENDGAKLPSTKISPVHRGDDSGTTKNFTDYLSKAGSWADEPDSLWPLKSGEAATGTSGMVEAVKNGEGTIGYADESQAGDVSIASLKVGDEYVAPSAEAAAKVVAISPRAEGRPEGDIAIDVDRTTTEAGAYPLILVSYVIACPTYKDAGTADMVKSFLSYVVSEDGQAAAASAAGSAPLPSELSEEAGKSLSVIAAK